MGGITVVDFRNPIPQPKGLLGTAISESNKIQSKKPKSSRGGTIGQPQQPQVVQTPEGTTRTTRQGEERFIGGKWVVTKSMRSPDQQPATQKKNIVQQWVGGVKQTGSQIGTAFSQLGKEDTWKKWEAGRKSAVNEFSSANRGFFVFGSRLPFYIFDKNKRSMDYLQPETKEKQLKERVSAFDISAKNFEQEVSKTDALNPTELAGLEIKRSNLVKQQEQLNLDIESFKKENKFSIGELGTGIGFSIATAPLVVPLLLSERSLVGYEVATETRAIVEKEGYGAGFENFKPFLVETGIQAGAWAVGWGISKGVAKVVTPKFETTATGEVIGKNWIGRRIVSQEKAFYNLRSPEVSNPYNFEVVGLSTKTKTGINSKAVGGFQFEQSTFVPKESTLGKIIKPVSSWKFDKITTERTMVFGKPTSISSSTGQSIRINTKTLMVSDKGKLASFNQGGVLGLQEVTPKGNIASGDVVFGTRGNIVTRGSNAITRGSSWSSIKVGDTVKGGKIVKIDAFSTQKGNYIETAIKLEEPNLVFSGNKYGLDFSASTETNLFSITRTSGNKAFTRTSSNVDFVSRIRDSFKSLFRGKDIFISKTKTNTRPSNIPFTSTPSQNNLATSQITPTTPTIKTGTKTISVKKVSQTPLFAVDTTALATTPKINTNIKGFGYSFGGLIKTPKLISDSDESLFTTSPIKEKSITKPYSINKQSPIAINIQSPTSISFITESLVQTPKQPTGTRSLIDTPVQPTPQIPLIPPLTTPTKPTTVAPFVFPPFPPFPSLSGSLGSGFGQIGKLGKQKFKYQSSLIAKVLRIKSKVTPKFSFTGLGIRPIISRTKSKRRKKK